METSAKKDPMGLRPVFRGGLAVVVIVLAVFQVIHQNRRPVAPVVKSAPRDRRISIEMPEGPPMKIDTDDLAEAGRERSDNGLGMVFCWCPPGQFWMGGGPKSARGNYLDSPPVRVAITQGYWMGKFEVTQAQWQQVSGKSLPQQRAMDPRQPRPLGDNSKREHAGMGPDYPIYFTSYEEAEEFCYRLTQAERQAGRLEFGWVYRLPTEAQWEFACRAGTTTATAFGDRLGSAQANFDGSVPFNNAEVGPFLRTTKPVGSYPANAWGLHDMHGSVWEWCRDGVDSTLVGGPRPLANPSTVYRSMRGGCWYEPGHRCLSTTRSWIRDKARGSGLGFRVALVSTELWREAESRATGTARRRNPE